MLCIINSSLKLRTEEEIEDNRASLILAIDTQSKQIAIRVMNTYTRFSSTKVVFRYTLSVLKIYNLSNINYRFSVLSVYVGTRPK